MVKKPATESSKNELTEKKITVTDTDSKPRRGLKRFSRRQLAITGAVVVLLLALVFIIPVSRYAVMGLIVKKPVDVTVVDSVSKKPVTEATVSVGGVSAKTDNEGKAALASVPVGSREVKVEKANYKTATATLLVPILTEPHQSDMKLEATGRAVDITVIDTISRQPVANAKIVSGDVAATSDEKGVAHVVLATNKAPYALTFTAGNYNEATLTIESLKDDQNVTATLTPAAKVYYLSKQTGKIDIMESNLDGSAPRVVLAGTGREIDNETMMTATSDWQHLALQANRDGATKLYLVNSKDGATSVIDEGKATFQMHGWIGHSLVYTVNRDQPLWQNGQIALKSYDAMAKKRTVIDETRGEGNDYWQYQAETIFDPKILGETVVYVKAWNFNNMDGADKKDQIISARPTGTKQVVKDLPANDVYYSGLKQNKVNGIMAMFQQKNTEKFLGYEYTVPTGVKDIAVDSQSFYNTNYPIFQKSASGNQTAWVESRDGRTIAYIGDANGLNAKENGVVDYQVYGWIGDKYILYSKNGSELYVFPASQTASDEVQPVKITNYHKPVNYYGYGYGAA